jgi:hypothetical protein
MTSQRRGKRRIGETTHRDTSEAGEKGAFPKHSGAAFCAEENVPHIARIARTHENLVGSRNDLHVLRGKVSRNTKHAPGSLLALRVTADANARWFSLDLDLE